MTRNSFFYRSRLTGACLGLAVVCSALNGCGSSEQAPSKAVDNATDNRIVDTAPPVAAPPAPGAKDITVKAASKDYSSLLFVFMLATFIGLGVILRVSRLLHTPLMSLTNAISAIAVVGSIIVTGSEGYTPFVRFLGGVALFASMTNIVSGFLITDRMLKMFKSPGSGGKR